MKARDKVRLWRQHEIPASPRRATAGRPSAKRLTGAGGRSGGDARVAQGRPRTGRSRRAGDPGGSGSGVSLSEARAAVARRLRRQAQACRALGSPLYAELLERSAADAPGSALAPRLMGAVHLLVLEGRAPSLARHYPSVGGGGRPYLALPIALRRFCGRTRS
jgi:Uncharacterized protein conserved in bacteria (DUF2332)